MNTTTNTIQQTAMLLTPHVEPIPSVDDIRIGLGEGERATIAFADPEITSDIFAELVAGQAEVDRYVATRRIFGAASSALINAGLFAASNAINQLLSAGDGGAAERARGAAWLVAHL